MSGPLVHRLTNQGSLSASAVACGDPTATIATWDGATVTCPACVQGLRAHCTCGPDTTPCAVCRQWHQTHRADGSRKRPPQAFHHESQFQEAIRRLARTAGFLTYHTLHSKGSEAGFPDLVLAKAGHPLWIIEAKMPTGRLTTPQQQWLDVLQTVTRVEAAVWRPEDMDHLLEVLR